MIDKFAWDLSSRELEYARDDYQETPEDLESIIVRLEDLIQLIRKFDHSTDKQIVKLANLINEDLIYFYFRTQFHKE